MKRGYDFLLAFFLALLLFSVFMAISPYLGFSGPALTGYASSGTAISNVTISKSYSITLSNNLSNGIQFGNLSGSSFTDANASSNYDSGVAVNGTTYLTNVSTDSTINVDFCIKANAALTDPSTADIIGLGNETYSNASTTSSTIPLLSNQVSLTTSAVKSGLNFAAGTGNHYRFWLDVPSTTPSGTYNNTLTFSGVERGDACV